MRIEQEIGDLLRREIRFSCDLGEGKDVGAGLLLRTLYQVARGAPAPGKIAAMIGVGRHGPNSAKACGRDGENDKNVGSCKACSHAVLLSESSEHYDLADMI